MLEHTLLHSHVRSPCHSHHKFDHMRITIVQVVEWLPSTTVYVRAANGDEDSLHATSFQVRHLVKSGASNSIIRCDVCKDDSLDPHRVRDDGRLMCEPCSADASPHTRFTGPAVRLGPARNIMAVLATGEQRAQAFDRRVILAVCSQPGCSARARNGWALCPEHLTTRRRAAQSSTDAPQPTDRANRYLRPDARDVCDGCGRELPGMCLSMCGHIVCTECVDGTSVTCPVADCGESIHAEHFTLMQPGFQLAYNETQPGLHDGTCTMCGLDLRSLPQTVVRTKTGKRDR